MEWRNRLLGRKVVLLGCGAVGEQMLALLDREIPGLHPRITVVDAMPCRRNVADAYGCDFRYARLTEENVGQTIGPILDEYTIVINATSQVQTSTIIRACQQTGALYIDTSNEVWSADSPLGLITADRLCSMDVIAAECVGGPTALICHGANPGLITHFVKEAILSAALQFDKTPSVVSGDWGAIAHSMGLTSVHLSELDTQISHSATVDDILTNTWSVSGFFEEADEPVHFAWGTEEIVSPPDSRLMRGPGQINLIQMRRKAHEVVVRSWIPSQGTFDALPIPHPEVFTIAKMLRHEVNNDNIYQPTVIFAYRPSAHCLHSLELRRRGTTVSRVLKRELNEGWDELGAFLTFRNGTALWYGSRLRLSHSRLTTPHGNATIQQVCAGILGGLAWMLMNPRRGLVRPEDIDHQLVLNVARPYLGLLGSMQCRWLDVDRRPPWPTAPLLRVGTSRANRDWPEPVAA